MEAVYRGKRGQTVWSVWRIEEGLLGPSAWHGFVPEGADPWDITVISGDDLRELELDGEGVKATTGAGAGG